MRPGGYTHPDVLDRPTEPSIITFVALGGPWWRADPGLLLILLFGVVLRSQYLTLPMAAAHRWREVTNAHIARNFYERSMNLFYPQVSWGRAAQPYVGMEFPLHVDVPQSMPEQGLREDLHRLPNELVIDLVLRKK